MIVWVDIIILENFIVNHFLLFITSQTLSLNANRKRMICAALVLALYTICIFYKFLNILMFLPFKIIIITAAIYIVFRKKDIKFLFKSTLVYILYAFALAGIYIFLEYKQTSTFASGLIITNFSTSKLFIAVMLAYMFIYRVSIYVIDKIKLNRYTYSIEIITKDATFNLKALLDTGNELREPISNLPVIIVEKKVLTNLEHLKYDKMYIPFKVVNGQSNVLEGFKPEYVKIFNDKNQWEDKSAVVAICDTNLSECNEYNALLSRGII